MFLRIVSRSILVIACAASVAARLPAQDNKPDGTQNKKLDVRSSIGDLHLGDDADARKTGLPLYPGARLKHDDDNGKINLGILTEAFGIKLVIVNYDSGDAPAKVIDFYREKLRKYGKVLECHSNKHGGDVDVNPDDKDSEESKELKCEGDNKGPVTELKVGTEDNQHLVAIEPNESHNGSTFALVYVHTRGKRGDI